MGQQHGVLGQDCRELGFGVFATFADKPISHSRACVTMLTGAGAAARAALAAATHFPRSRQIACSPGPVLARDGRSSWYFSSLSLVLLRDR
jgi:hypothetical protein